MKYYSCLAFVLISIITGFPGYSIHAQGANPDNVYPIPNNLGSTNEYGINKFTGDLNLKFPLARIQATTVSYTLDAFYNSRSASLSDKVDNALGGDGWKILDYPKIAKNENGFSLLDGQSEIPLIKDEEGYNGDGPYFRWLFNLENDSWSITTDQGVKYRLDFKSTINENEIWHISKIQDLNWQNNLVFEYSKDTLLSITNNLGDSLSCQYNELGHLAEIISYRKKDYAKAVVIKYNNYRNPIAIQNPLELKNGFSTNISPEMTFLYDSNERVKSIVNPNGAIVNYTYYVGEKYAEHLLGAVISYDIDDGYYNVRSDASVSDPLNPDASYNAVWYELANASKDAKYSIYNHYNVTRIYPGGYRKDNPMDYDNNDLTYPFGHDVYYFFNGKSASDLISLPTEYQDQTVTDENYLGILYRSDQYNGNELVEKESDLIADFQYLYHPQTFSTASYLQLTKTIQSTDQTKATTTWYSYYDEDNFNLPYRIIQSRRNPKKNDPGYQEYEMEQISYYFQYNSELKSLHLLTPLHTSFVSITNASNGDDPEIIADDLWQVIQGNKYEWKKWYSSSWAPEFSWVLRNKANLNQIDQLTDNDWLVVNNILGRRINGNITRMTDASKIVKSIGWDNVHATQPVSNFVNGDVTNGEAAFLGFESYESAKKWNLSGGVLQRGNAHTGIQSYTGENGIQIISDQFMPKKASQYLFGAFIKTGPYGSGKIGFKNKNSWLGNPTEIKPNMEGVYLQNIVADPNSSTKPTIECSDCNVDDIRFHPLDAFFSATVYQDTKVALDNVTVDAAGAYAANEKITIKEGFILNEEEYLFLSAGQEIGFSKNIAFKVGSTLNSTIKAFDIDLTRPVAKLGGNGETSRIIYDAAQVPVSITGPAGELRSLQVAYNSKKDMQLFGPSKPEEEYFDGAYPNMLLQVISREKGIWEGFNRWQEDINFELEDLSVINDLLVGPFQEGEIGTAVLKTKPKSDNFAIYVESLPKLMDENDLVNMLMRLNDGAKELRLEYSRNNLSFYVDGELKLDQPIKKSPNHLNLMITMIEGHRVEAYVNGRLLYKQDISDYLTVEEIQLTSQNPNHSFANFMLLEDILMQKKTFDALGRSKQQINALGRDQVIVSEQLYGNDLNLNLGSTRFTNIDARGLSYYADFANVSFDCVGEICLSDDSEISQYYATNKPFLSSRFFQDDPIIRSSKTGTGGNFTAGGKGDINYLYGANVATPFDYPNALLAQTEQQLPEIEPATTIAALEYTSPESNLTFATQLKSELLGPVKLAKDDGRILQQVIYNQQGLPTQYFQPNSFQQELKSFSDFSSKMSYDYLGNLVHTADSDRGTIQMAYDLGNRPRLMLDANGAAMMNGLSYVLYHKYDALNRIVEEGLYEDKGISQIVSPSRKSSQSILVPGQLEVQAGDYGEDLELNAGVTIRFAPGFKLKLRHTLHAGIQKEALQMYYAIELKDKNWPDAGDPARKKKRIFTYDQDASNPENKIVGRLAKVNTYNTAGVEDDYIEDKYTYDLNGDIVTFEQNIASNNSSIKGIAKYSYNAMGQITQIENPLSPKAYSISYSYDEVGRISDISSTENKFNFANYGYYDRWFAENLANSVVKGGFEFNDENLLYVIFYSSKGNNIFIEEIFHESRPDRSAGYFNGATAAINYDYENISSKYNYYYDEIGQLIEANDIQWTYDANGNIESKDKWKYNYYSGTNQLENIAPLAVDYENETNMSFAYDANGNVSSTEDGKNRFSYDPFTGLPKSYLDLTFEYNANNQRVVKKSASSNSSTYYFYGLNNFPLWRTTITNGDKYVSSYVYGPTGLIATISASSNSISKDTSFVIKDHLGSTRLLIDKQGNTKGYANYDNFGKITSSSDDFLKHNHYLYTGQEYDTETGFYNFKARWYDPEIGRFYAPDPASQSLSPYSFVGNNPVSYLDPTGEYLIFAGNGLVMGGLNVFSNWNSNSTALDVGAYFVFGFSSGLVGTLNYPGTTSAASALSGGLNAWYQGEDYFKGALVNGMMGLSAELSAAYIQPKLGIAGIKGVALDYGFSGAASGAISGFTKHSSYYAYEIGLGNLSFNSTEYAQNALESAVNGATVGAATSVALGMSQVATANFMNGRIWNQYEQKAETTWIRRHPGARLERYRAPQGTLAIGLEGFGPLKMRLTYATNGDRRAPRAIRNQAEFFGIANRNVQRSHLDAEASLINSRLPENGPLVFIASSRIVCQGCSGAMTKAGVKFSRAVQQTLRRRTWRNPLTGDLEVLRPVP